MFADTAHAPSSMICCLAARNHMTGRGPCYAMRLSVCERNNASPNRDAEAVLPGGRPHPQEGRAGRPGLPEPPGESLEAPAHEQPAGAHQQGDKAQVTSGAGVPVAGVAGADGGRGHVRPGRGEVERQALLEARHVRAARRAGRGGSPSFRRRSSSQPPVSWRGGPSRRAWTLRTSWKRRGSG